MGEPALPVITQNIGIPNGSIYDVQIVEEEWTDLELGTVYPAQELLTGQDVSSPFSFSDEVYNRSVYQPALFTVSDEMTWKGVSNIVLSICPFKYYPLSGKLSVLSKFNLEVTFRNNGERSISTISASDGDLRLFDNIGFLQPSETNRSLATGLSRNANDYDYLIIVGNIPSIENSQAMQKFRRWKALKGYKTKMVSTSVIGTDSASIKNYIIQESSHNISYVLFVGDHTKIPLPKFVAKHVQSNHPVDYSDYWYGCLDGDNDFQAELPIGRFVANNLDQFTNMVNKTIMYESLPNDWTNKALLCAHAQNDSHANYQKPMDTIRYRNYTHPMDFHTAYARPVSLGGDSATAAYVYDRINEKMNIVAHNGHGNFDAMYLSNNPSGIEWDVYDTCQIDNGTYSFFVSTGCYVGGIYSNISVMNSFTRSTHCASAFLGCSVPAFTDPSDDYIKKGSTRICVGKA